MLTFEALNAKHGDSLIVRWGRGDATHVALIDGGPSGVWTGTLRPRLLALAGNGTSARLALVAVSHIDADHIDGVLRLLNEMRDAHDARLESPWRIDRLWHNAPEPGMPAAGARAGAAAAVSQSIKQGREVRDLAGLLGLAGNPPLGGVVTAGLRADVEGMSIVVVGPRPAELAAQWARWQRSDAQATAAAYSDANVFNQASIVLLLAYDGVTMLLTGDARGDHILAGLAEAGRLDGGRLHVTLMKVPHHGSSANVTPEFFEAVTADHYVVSANGTHGHPHPDVLDWIARSRRGESFTVHLTNPMPSFHRRDSDDGFGIRVRAADQPGVRVVLHDEGGPSA
ncbi:hypothetical protein JIG36_01250 [Actinoplanes sp. LDG1-06]|uniref:MBL fold metallo-hydrolase n=1 Tax=Paractinoplanes ovalisporus TaxID=2810368 RepID=A0ABS2A4M1_9ACTN|nr:hypothetical protein [Actinoplanes ovalisporus]MBM2614181.1 hypothetical protein [Actinoplanes ovalisporus]